MRFHFVRARAVAKQAKAAVGAAPAAVVGVHRAVVAGRGVTMAQGRGRRVGGGQPGARCAEEQQQKTRHGADS